MVDHTNDRLRHEQEMAAQRTVPPPSSGFYSGDEVLIIPLGLLGVLALLGTLMLVFQP